MNKKNVVKAKIIKIIDVSKKNDIVKAIDNSYTYCYYYDNFFRENMFNNYYDGYRDYDEIIVYKYLLLIEYKLQKQKYIREIFFETTKHIKKGNSIKIKFDDAFEKIVEIY